MQIKIEINLEDFATRNLLNPMFKAYRAEGLRLLFASGLYHSCG